MDVSGAVAMASSISRASRARNRDRSDSCTMRAPVPTLPVRRHGDPVGLHASLDVPVVTAGLTCGEARSRILGRRYAVADGVAVLADDGSLETVVAMEDLLAADADLPVEDVPGADGFVVSPDADRGHVAWRAAEAGGAVVAVVDEQRRFEGLVSRAELLGVLVAEHEEHLGRLAGSPSSARDAAEEPVRARLHHRMPWLLVGLLGAMLSALLVGAFEERLEANVLLAIFVPAVVYMADAVGTQTEVLVIRGLSVGINLRAVFRRELITGASIGLFIAGGFLPFATLVWGDTSVAVAVALSLFASCSIATVVAIVLPVLLHRRGQDPAYGSGPVATVVQDLLSIAVYFAVASAIV